jgi:hypothetical protein
MNEIDLPVAVVTLCLMNFHKVPIVPTSHLACIFGLVGMTAGHDYGRKVDAVVCCYAKGTRWLVTTSKGLQS